MEEGKRLEICSSLFAVLSMQTVPSVSHSLLVRGFLPIQADKRIHSYGINERLVEVLVVRVIPHYVVSVAKKAFEGVLAKGRRTLRQMQGILCSSAKKK